MQNEGTHTGPRLQSSFQRQMNGNMNGGHHGFSHGAFAANQPGYADRHPERSNNMSINTGRLNPSNQNGADMQTPGTGYDMNFTPLLPSQLLLGSPFQPVFFFKQKTAYEIST